MTNSKWQTLAEWGTYSILAAMSAAVWAVFARFCRASWEVAALVFVAVFLGECIVISCVVGGNYDHQRKS